LLHIAAPPGNSDLALAELLGQPLVGLSFSNQNDLKTIAFHCKIDWMALDDKNKH